MIKALGLALSFGAILAAASARADDTVTPFSPDDPQMEAAILAAQQTLPLFLTYVLLNGQPSIPDALIKVDFRLTSADAAQADGSTSEVMWIEPFSEVAPNTFKGILVNEPVFITGLYEGDRVTFDVSRIMDWAWYGPDGIIYGQYTTRVMLQIDGSSSALDELAAFPADPLPADWR